MNDRPPPARNQGAERPQISIVRKMDVAVVWDCGTVREGKLGLAWGPDDPLAVLLRLSAVRASGEGVIAGTLTLARQFFGDLVRYGVVDPDGGVVSGRMAGETTYSLVLHLNGGNVEIYLPVVELARFLAATEKACPAGSIREAGAVYADLDGYLAAATS